MSTKYSVSPRERWRLHADDRPRFTDHSIDRHNDRTPDWASSPETAYLEGVTLVGLSRTVFTDKGGQTPEKAVFYAESRNGESYGIILLIRNQHVITVYSLQSLKAAPRAYLEALAEEEGFL